MADPEIAKLRWRCRRGMRELDMLLLGYVDDVYLHSTAEKQAAFRRFLTIPDPEILALLTGRSHADDAGVAGIVATLLERGPA